MKDSKYRGVVVPMITPVTEQGELDIQAVEKIIELFAKHGVSPLLMGTTGEGNSVSPQQGYLFVKTAAATAAARCRAQVSMREGAACPGEVPMLIYAGLNGCCVSEHIRSANQYHQLGADVIVATLPSYYALTDEQIYNYYKTLADNITAPLMLYNIKATTHMSIPVEVVKRLSNHPNIVGLKDSERDLERMEACLAISKDNPDFAYFCGWAAQSASSVLNGADGIVPSTGNFTPELFAELYDAAVSGDAGKANDLQKKTDEIARIYQEGRTLGQSLAALKVMMNTQKLCQPWMLAPLTRLSAEEEKEIIGKTAGI
ncbi:dihydrodipicolinate synthase family protein [Bacteroides sp. 51]|uniref:dihydrodipicolinate synthase family protein n=1 Tax=Bacteroides sp. 51 TaxID=2302938 RepID=UPI0013D2FB8D|nr:dihydrodipicolinate synthase family protein [Bacteroides sp. 51]NDV80384.1 dihydrodipicolinate synthase family protein [Bacteroides sp. 51]